MHFFCHHSIWKACLFQSLWVQKLFGYCISFLCSHGRNAWLSHYDQHATTAVLGYPCTLIAIHFIYCIPNLERCLKSLLGLYKLFLVKWSMINPPVIKYFVMTPGTIMWHHLVKWHDLLSLKMERTVLHSLKPSYCLTFTILGEMLYIGQGQMLDDVWITNTHPTTKVLEGATWLQFHCSTAEYWLHTLLSNIWHWVWL